MREQIGALLQEHGWGNASAQQLAHWNPYDQNASADFFDVEWMFGLMDGFDVVIGNPPYFNVETLGAKSKYAEQIKKNYAEIWMDKSDILFYFIKAGVNFVKPQSSVFYIISNAFLFSDKAQKIAELYCAEIPY
ncbi:Eco57I restriction-modification methylase domain-containing protein [Methylocucumis oryzae]|uniref:Eco57I restriction-modification methylase domain-containing protein n=1 Tax=Methylocucumis oryzae TaxID=1632867 RepID=UPI000698809F|nr:Eco57I restriction-modification methylase domain-containing protein [Methylocucumis oryzae]